MSDPPNKPRDPTSAVESVGAAKPPKAAQAASEVDSTAAAAAADAATGVGGPDLAIAEALSTGSVDPAQARDQLVDQVVRSQLPEDASPELIERVRSEVEALLADDPTLGALLDPKR